MFFLLVPFFAALLRLLYRRRESFFVPHLVFALHFHAAAFVLFTVGEVGEWLTGQGFPGAVAGLAIVTLLFQSLRAAYGGSRTTTLFKQFTLLSIHTTAAAMALTFVFVIAGLAL